MTKRHRVWEWMASASATRTITFGMILYLVALGILYRRQAELVDCHARYAEASAVSTLARTEAAAEDRRVLDELITAVATADSANATRAALVRYRETRAATDERRRLSPLPDPPSQRC